MLKDVAKTIGMQHLLYNLQHIIYCIFFALRNFATEFETRIIVQIEITKSN